jgi:hypothetical protein
MSVREGADTWLPAMRACLTHARSRWRLGTMLRGAVWSLLLGLIVLCALEAMRTFLNGWPAARWLPVLTGIPLLNHVALSATAFAVAFTIAVLLTFLLAPDLADLARAADRKFALKERLSTALEVAGNTQSNMELDPVRAALLADAERTASAIDPRGLVRLALPRAAWMVPALIMIAFLLQVVPPDAFGRAAPGATTASDAGVLSRQQAADTAANLRRIAEILDQDATQRSDPYLRTIARTLERLSTEAAQATVDRRQLASELERLLAHAQQAYAQSERPAGQTAVRTNPTAMLRSALDDITGNRQASAPLARDSEPSVPNPTAAQRDPVGRPVPQPERRASGARTPAEQLAAVRRLPGADLPWMFVDEDGAEVDPRSQIERLMAEEERRARGGGQAAGAGASAGQGDGDRAGDGVQPLGRGNAAKPGDLAATEPMLLPDPERRNGSRIRIEIPSEALRSEVAAPTTDAGGGWRRAREQPVERPALAAEGRSVVGRYFRRSTEGRDAKGQAPQGRSP